MKKSKAILMVVCAMLLVAASVMGTLAYLTSTPEAVVNTFTVGKVAITMDEKDVDNSTTGADRDTANSYKLMPGHEYEKDPTIHVDSTSEPCYLFVKVVNDIAAIEAKGDTTVAAQMTANGWEAVEDQTGVFVYTNQTGKPVAVAGGENKKVFDKFVIDDGVDNATLATYNNKTITINAYAIQVDTLSEKSAAEIWASFPTAPAATEPSDPETT